jgi:adenylate kinase
VNIILFGPPGAGKGTQASSLAKEFKFNKISTGDLLRNEIKNKSKLGDTIKSIIDRGELVSDDITSDLIKKDLSSKNIYSRLLFDGYPRNLEQAKELEIMLKKNYQKISCVISLEVEKEVIVKRILGRQTCSSCNRIFNEYFSPATKENHSCDKKYLQKRSDDNEQTILNRFETYLKKTLPILNFYKDQKILHQINGKSKIDHIYKEIQGIITSIET